MSDGEQNPAQRFGGQAITSRVRVEDAPFTVQVHEAYRGELQYIRLGSENIFQIRATSDDARGTARVEISDDDLRELYEALGEVVDE